MALAENPFRVRRHIYHDYYNNNTSNISQSQDDSEDPTSSTFRVLSNKEILQHIFSYLASANFKRSRAVCRKWKNAGELLFKKRFRICFDFQEDPPYASQYEAPRNPIRFVQHSQEDFPFQAIRLGNKLPWIESTLTQLFSTVGKFITDLTLSDVYLPTGNENEIGSYLKCYDLTALLGGIQNLNILKIEKRRYLTEDRTRFSVSLRVLQRIEYIHLENCEIELTDDVTVVLHPKELQLRGITFSLHKEAIENILLNEIVDFGIITKLSVAGGCWFRVNKIAKVKLDLAGSVVLKLLDLTHVELLNVENSSWNVNSLYTRFIPFERKTKMTVKNFSISFAKCSLTLLPQNVEILNLEDGVEFVESNTAEFKDPWEFIFPNIKRLKLGDNVSPKIFPQLNVCFNNLTELILSAYDDISIDISMIPKSVKAVCLSYHGLQFVGHAVCELDTLTIKSTTNLEFVERCLNHFTPKSSLSLQFCFFDFEFDRIRLGALFDTSIPKVYISYFPENVFEMLINNYNMFKSIDKYRRIGHMVNSKGSKISVCYV